MNRIDFHAMLPRSLHPFRRTILAWFFLLSLFPLATARGQDGSVLIEIDRPDDIGLEGVIRPGTWAPMKLTLRNNLPSIRKVSVDWIAPDADGDLVIARRENVVLNPNGTTVVRLYAMPAVNSKPADGWTVRVVDAETDQVVASTKVAPRTVLLAKVGVIGITGGGLMGLASFRDIHTQHEQMEVISGIDPSLLPDRWYGMKLMDALVWTPSAARSPADPSVPIAAIKEWVRRGGHLVIVLSAVDTGWSDPKVADLMPPVTIGAAMTLTPLPPRWLYETSDALNEETREDRVIGLNFSVRPLTLPTAAAARDASLITPGNIVGNPGEPALVAAHQYGFGRVTLIGLDITDRRMAGTAAFVRYGLPRLWQTVFGWRSPGNLPVATLLDERKMVPVMARGEESTDITSDIPGRISMKTTAAATLFAAIVLFGVYWVVAGPGMFAALKARKMLHHSWLAFGCVVLAFSGITWLAAMVLRPGMTEIEHFSFVDIDCSQRGPAQIRAQSYFSLFVPKHGTIDVAVVTPPDRGNQNALASPGLPGSDRSSFVDERRYTINTLSVAAAPRVPMRSTAKQFEVQYCDILDASKFARQWSPPEGRLRLVNGWPTGELTHSLPGTLTNVRLIYCPGEGKMALFWNPNSPTWQPGTAMTLSKPVNMLPLVVAPAKVRYVNQRDTTKNKKPNGWEKRSLASEGLLGDHMGKLGGQRNEQIDDNGNAKLVNRGESDFIRALEMATFFSMLPPPDFMMDDSPGLIGTTPAHFTRHVARSADLSHLTAVRRVIVLGHLEKNSPIPVPITVDGDEVDSSGWTMVRFVLPVEEE